MTILRYTDADLAKAYAAGVLDDLAFTVHAPGECRCVDEAWERASATQVPEYGVVTPDEARGCRQPEKWCGGTALFSCSNTAALWDALADAGFATDDAKDAEALRRLDLAERMAEAQAKMLAFSLDTLDLKPAPDATAAELEASRILIDAGHSPAAVARAGRALHSKEIR